MSEGNRRFHEYVNPEDLAQVRYLIDHSGSYEEPMWNASRDGYPELVEVMPDRVIFTEYLGDHVQYVRECFPDGSMDTRVERP